MQITQFGSSNNSGVRKSIDTANKDIFFDEQKEFIDKTKSSRVSRANRMPPDPSARAAHKQELHKNYIQLNKLNVSDSDSQRLAFVTFENINGGGAV